MEQIINVNRQIISIYVLLILTVILLIIQLSIDKATNGSE